MYRGPLFVGLGAVTVRCGEAADGARLLGMAVAAANGRSNLDPPDLAVFDLAERRAVAVLGDAAFNVCMEAGALVSEENAYREGRALIAALRTRPRPAAETGGAEGGSAALTGLSGRETEVIGMLARGLSNREIADTLVLSTRTVETHVANAYAKLGVSNRAEATARAIHLGIAARSARDGLRSRIP